MNIQAVIFDMDGVLVDSEPLIAQAAIEIFKRRGVAVCANDFLPFVGTGEERYLVGVAEKFGISLTFPQTKNELYSIYLDLVPAQLRAFPGVHNLVHQLKKRNIKIAVASSADKIKIDANLAAIKLEASMWDALVTSEDVVHKKPAPDIFIKAAKLLKVGPTKCVVIEDAVHGVTAAKAANMRCVAVAHSFAADKLAEADVVRETIAEVTLEDLMVDAD